ncbi:glycosyltransferase family 2 protein [Aestuariimicrobium sp. Y1814]|uniref:glycosyltransferase family 2 protein n=1 Tax=Aestuariimicrobium sp. Y1814 TaxID=3418742 RepID=UPI003DA74E14
MRVNLPPYEYVKRASAAAKRADITVVMPMHNVAEYVGEAITSVLEQTHQDFILHVHDDGSTDESIQEALRVIGDDDRCTITRSENHGAPTARNIIIQQATTPLLAIMDSDDIALPHRLASHVELFAEHPEVDIHAGAIETFGEGIVPRIAAPDANGPRLLVELLRDCHIPNTASAVRTHVAQAFPQDPELHAAEDWDFWSRLATHKHRHFFTSEVLTRYRIRRGSLTRNLQSHDAYRLVASRHRERVVSGPGADQFGEWLYWSSHKDQRLLTQLAWGNASVRMAMGEALDGVDLGPLDKATVHQILDELLRAQYVGQPTLVSASTALALIPRLGLRPFLVTLKRVVTSRQRWRWSTGHELVDWSTAPLTAGAAHDSADATYERGKP